MRERAWLEIDPISTAVTASKAATTAWDIGQALYSFIKRTKNVDQSVKDPQLTVKNLGTTCSSVKTLLSSVSDPERLAIESRDPVIWTNPNDGIEDVAQMVERVGL